MQNTQPYIQWYKIERKEYERRNKLYMIYVCSTNDKTRAQRKILRMSFRHAVTCDE